MTMKLVCEILVNGVMSTKVLTTADSMDQGALVKTKPGVGKPFLMFASLPGSVIAADFEGAPVVSTSTVENNQAIQAMLSEPQTYLSRLTFA